MNRYAIAVAAIVVVCAFGWLVGCRAEECQQVVECCGEVRDHQAVGAACGEMADQVRDPDTCRTVMKTIRAMFEEREETLPAACR